MSKAPDGVDHEHLYLAARRVLLDTLQVLSGHVGAVTIVGAQAVYLRSAEVDLGVASFTSDADLCLDSEQLADEPLLQEAMREAGFELRNPDNPGLWQRQNTSTV